MLLYLAIILLTLIFVLWKYNKRPQGLPPGPPVLPLVGSLPWVSDKTGLHSKFKEMENKYGDTFSFKKNLLTEFLRSCVIGQDTVVISKDFNFVNKVLKDENMQGRQELPAFDHFRLGGRRCGGEPIKGIIFSQGKVWTEQRRFSLRHLRDFGFGKSSMNDLILEEVNKLVDRLEADLNRPMSLRKIFNLSVINALWRITTGQSYSLDDPFLKDIIEKFEKLVRFEGISFLTVLAPPWLLDILPDRLLGIDVAARFFEPLKQCMRDTIRQHQVGHDPDDLRDFIDVYREEINRTIDPKSSFYGREGERNLEITLMDLFGAGSETTSTTLVWCFLFLCRHMDMQDRMRQEIDGAVGKDRQVQLTDRQHLPFVEAFIQEVLRMTSLLAVGLPHTATKTVEIGGVVFPKGTVFQPHIWQIHHDPRYWNSPEDFRPDRFIDQNGKFRPDPRVIPFQVGRRFCLGQSLALSELFMFLANLAQQFSFKFAAGYTPANLKMENVDLFGINLPPYFEVLILKA